MTIQNHAYAEHRARSLVYYWMALLDATNPNTAAFQEIFAPTIELHLGSQIYSDERSFLTWFVENSSRLLKSAHQVEQFSIQLLKDSTYEVSFEAEWRGQLKASPNQLLEGRTKHEWVIVDNPMESFARIKRILVSTIKPFQPVCADSVA